MKKVHYLADCSTYGDARTSKSTKNIREVTCGSCKQAILRVLLFEDWSKLAPELASMLEDLATQVRR